MQVIFETTNVLIGLAMCAFAMMLMFCAGFVFCKLIDLIQGER